MLKKSVAMILALSLLGILAAVPDALAKRKDDPAPAPPCGLEDVCHPEF